VSIGLECVIGNGVRISNSVLLHRVKVRLFICAFLGGIQQRSTMPQFSLSAATTAAQTQTESAAAYSQSE
jgi:NDP-sugar pyrophosphorylase family protein